MKAKTFTAMMALSVLCAVASAQNYSIRVTYNTNLRVAGSLQARIVETAPAGTILNVIGSADRWLQISRNGNVWMADWVGHTRVEQTAPTQTQTQTVSNIDNCCFVDRQCAIDQQWTDGYWAFQNGQCTPPTGPQTQTSTQITSTGSAQVDNCCFVDRQCNSDAEWSDGYWAFQNNQCSASTQTQTQTSSQPVSAGPAQIDNCCQVNRQCHTDDDWVRGFHDFQSNQCAGSAPTTSSAPITGPIPEGVDNCCQVNRQCATDEDWTRGWLAFKHFQCNIPSVKQGVSIVGGAGFVSQMKDALYLLRESAPQWWVYATSGLDKIVQDLSNDVPGVNTETRTFRIDYTDHIPAGYEATHVFDTASMLVHEACHVHRDEAGLESGGYRGEKACLEKEVEVFHALDPHNQNSAIAGLKEYALNVLANIHRPECQWWWGEYRSCG